MRVDDGRTDPRVLRDLANSQGPQDEAYKTAVAIRNDARRLAPRRTGNLRRNIKVEEFVDLKTGIKGYAVGWDDDGWYGWMVEAGTEHSDAKPHLTPAAIKHGALGPGPRGDV